MADARRRARAQIGAGLGRLVVPFPAGGGTDAVARTLAEKLRAAYPGGLIVENRPGASGRRGIETVRDAPADGSTLLLVPDLVMTLYPYSFRHLGYDRCMTWRRSRYARRPRTRSSPGRRCPLR